MEDINRLNRAIDGRIQVEFAFIEAMKQEFQRIQHSLNECIWRHPEDYQLVQVKKDIGKLGNLYKRKLKLGQFVGGKYTRKSRLK